MSSPIKKSDVRREIARAMGEFGIALQSVRGLGKAFVYDTGDVSPFAIIQIDLRSNVLCLSAFMGLRLGGHGGGFLPLGNTLNISDFDRFHHHFSEDGVVDYIVEFSKTVQKYLALLPRGRSELLQAIGVGSIGQFSVDRIKASLGEDPEERVGRIVAWLHGKELDISSL